MIACLAANPSIDRLFEVERLTPGAIHRPLRSVERAGGKGLNCARAVRSLGADVVAIPLLRGHAGRWIADELAAEGVAVEAVASSGENRTSLSVADRETGGLTEFYEHGPDATPAMWAELLAALDRALPRASWLTISGSLPPGLPDDGYATAVRRARDAGVAVALDTEGERLRRALAERPEVVKVNATEAGDLLGRTVASREDALGAARDLRALAGGEGAALVTRGAEGAVLVAPDGTARGGALHVRGPYSVGSGDAFLAGLVVGLERGSGWEAAFALALAAAAANAEAPGAGHLDPLRARSLVASAELRDLV